MIQITMNHADSFGHGTDMGIIDNRSLWKVWTLFLGI